MSFFENLLGKTRTSFLKASKDAETAGARKVEEELACLHKAFARQERLFSSDEYRALEQRRQQAARNLDAAVAAGGEPGVAALLRFVKNGLASPDTAPAGAAIRALGRAGASQAVPLLQSLVQSDAKMELKSAAGEALTLLQGGPDPWDLLKQAEKKHPVAGGDERLRLLDRIDARSFDRLGAQEKYYVWYLRAMVYKYRGDRDQAIACLNTALQYFNRPAALAWMELKQLQNPWSHASRVAAGREPKKLEDAAPVYPAQASQDNIHGVVVLDCLIGPHGRIEDVQVKSSVPPLDQAAIDAVKKWVFAPTIRDGLPVPVVLTVPVQFSGQQKTEEIAMAPLADIAMTASSPDVRKAADKELTGQTDSTKPQLPLAAGLQLAKIEKKANGICVIENYDGPVAFPNDRVIIDSGITVRGEVHALIVEVLGGAAVFGNVRGEAEVHVNKDAKLVGDITTARVFLENGAYFKGGIKIIRPAAQAALADLARTHSGPDVRKAAIEKRADQGPRVAARQKLSGLPTELLIGEYLRHLAADWWAGQPSSRSVATCDACSARPVSRNKGYLIASSLWCEDCYRDKDIAGQLRRNPDAAGYGVLQSARRWAQG
jgi:TonB family protein